MIDCCSGRLQVDFCWGGGFGQLFELNTDRCEFGPGTKHYLKCSITHGSTAGLSEASAGGDSNARHASTFTSIGQHDRHAAASQGFSF